MLSKRAGNSRLKNRAAGVVPSAARQSKFMRALTRVGGTKHHFVPPKISPVLGGSHFDLRYPWAYESVDIATPEAVARAERLRTQVPSHSGLRRTSSRGADQG